MSIEIFTCPHHMPLETLTAVGDELTRAIADYVQDDGIAVVVDNQKPDVTIKVDEFRYGYFKDLDLWVLESTENSWVGVQRMNVPFFILQLEQILSR